MMEDEARKRTREELEAEDKKNRGSYRCSRCNLPKKGHVCPYQPKFKKRETISDTAVNASVQAELDEDMTIRNLELEKQGLPSSYVPISSNRIQSMSSVSKDTIYSDSLISSLLAADRQARAATANAAAAEPETPSASEA